jgi:hypothetical protein
MTRKVFAALGLACAAAALLALPAAGGGSGSNEVNPNGIVVDDDAQCPGTDYTSIQAAVLASPPGSKIQVCPGVYNEQVVITKPLDIQGVSYANQDQPLVKPNAAAPNSTSLTTGNPVAAIILVEATKNVTFENMTVDGSTSGINGCAPTYVGIYYRNASGRIEDNAVRNIALGPTLFGCQSGLGIFVQSGAETGVDPHSKVEIDGNTVHGYQKNGITANEAGTDVSIHDNTVGGAGSTDAIAQNGIQVADGAHADVAKNLVINHVYGLCASADNCAAASANILLIDADKPNVHDNSVGNAQLDIYQEGDKGKIQHNTIFQAQVFDGIDLIGNDNEAKDNTIDDSEADGVYVEGTGNHVNGNTINEATNGIDNAAGSSGGNFTGNHFVNVVNEVVGVSSTTAKRLAALTARAASPAQP